MKTTAVFFKTLDEVTKYCTDINGRPDIDIMGPIVTIQADDGSVFYSVTVRSWPLD
jgi:hypothetical protein